MGALHLAEMWEGTNPTSCRSDDPEQREGKEESMR
jgi:hypothetical protein